MFFFSKLICGFMAYYRLTPLCAFSLDVNQLFCRSYFSTSNVNYYKFQTTAISQQNRYSLN